MSKQSSYIRTTGGEIKVVFYLNVAHGLLFLRGLLDQYSRNIFIGNYRFQSLRNKRAALTKVDFSRGCSLFPNKIQIEKVKAIFDSLSLKKKKDLGKLVLFQKPNQKKLEKKDNPKVLTCFALL